MSRAGLALAIAAAVAVAPATACRRSPPPPSPTPRAAAAGTALNVLLITIDTLRADHMGVYGYRRATSPHMDRFGGQGAVFEQAYSYWPKTRGSFVAMLTGRRDSQTGYGKTHPTLLGFNPTLASVLKDAGYRTVAALDNANLSAQNGYAKGFEAYRETWQEAALATEMDRTRAITESGLEVLRRPGERPFFLWLHYVNPHAPYAPPPPYDTAFMDAAARSGPVLPLVGGFHGGIPKRWAVPGERRLGYYVAQYDGEIAAVDAEVGRVLDELRAGGLGDRTVVLLSSDHGESLGEHDYYFDHGHDLFDPSLRVPLLVRVPGAPAGVRSGELASTLDLVPTVLDAVKVSYPPDLAGRSLLRAVQGGEGPGHERLHARNDRNLSAAWDRRLKVVATPTDEGGTRWALYDRTLDAQEAVDVSRAREAELRAWRRELELFLERADREWAHTRRLAGEPAEQARLSPEACANVRALGYVVAECQD